MNEIHELNERKSEEEKNIKYNPNDIFKKEIEEEKKFMEKKEKIMIITIINQK